MKDNLNTLLNEAIEDNKKEKLFLIEDIVKAKKFLYSQGQKQHNEFMEDSTAADLFDELYDLEFDQLKAIYQGYEQQINQLVLNQYQPL